MQITAQGTREPGRQRYQAIPRTLVFLTSINPQHGGRDILLLKGAPSKRLWAGLYNGLGGHIEADEDIYGAALREVAEEAGLHVAQLFLRAVVNIDTGADEQGQRPGVMMFVFLGETSERTVRPTAEGAPEWLAIDQLQALPLVNDLHELLPRVLDGGFVYGHYVPGENGRLAYWFR